VPRKFILATFVFAACASLLIAQEPAAQQQPALPQEKSPAVQAPAPVHAGPVIVLDPGHGGTDTGARGTSGAVEKDVALAFARAARAELERAGFRVVMTRNDDSNPSYDDRAAIANAYRDAIFISFHVSSTGAAPTVRSYYYRFSTPMAQDNPDSSAAADLLTPWEEAQRPYVDASRRLGEAIQVQLAQRVPGSPAVPAAFAVRELRSVAAPSIAIEVSSVSAADPNALGQLAVPLAAGIARGVAVFRPPTPPPSAAPGAK
jgi:N-acetylmuramoyl-L-alanine amidase